MDYNWVLLGLVLSTLFKINGFFDDVSSLHYTQISNELYHWLILRLLKFCFARFGMLIFTHCCKKQIDVSDLPPNYKSVLNTSLVAACYLYVCHF